MGVEKSNVPEDAAQQTINGFGEDDILKIRIWKNKTVSYKEDLGKKRGNAVSQKVIQEIKGYW
ncbi:MAG: hypothetical protein DDT40_00326 [candidate division WS2 bacterium]|nr:hypothetical protein [Candidatus Psychracetigena formicireducens]